MEEKFIERATEFALQDGKLTVFETNCKCRNVKFYFEKYVMTLMLAGHKTVVSPNLSLEFFPGTFLIPEKNCTQYVSIPAASFDNPTKCLVLEIDPVFLRQFYEEFYRIVDISNQVEEEDLEGYFISNDQAIINIFGRIYKHSLEERTKANDFIGNLLVKELLTRVFQTRGVRLLKENFEQEIGEKGIQESIRYIKKHIDEKIKIGDLAEVAQLGLTTFHKKFKLVTGTSPSEFILKEKIHHAKILIAKNQLSLKQIAFKSGFSSYEYFCVSFKKAEKMKPMEFKRSVLIQEVAILR